MERAVKYFSILANVLFLFGVFILMMDNRPHGMEYFYFLLLFVYPALNLLALCNGGMDAEERRLRRQVNKAELRKRLKDLGEI